MKCFKKFRNSKSDREWLSNGKKDLSQLKNDQDRIASSKQHPCEIKNAFNLTFRVQEEIENTIAE